MRQPGIAARRQTVSPGQVAEKFLLAADCGGSNDIDNSDTAITADTARVTTIMDAQTRRLPAMVGQYSRQRR